MSPRRATASDESNLWQSFKRQSIQEAVIRLMCRDGLQSVTMERVAQEVGIAKGTVYLHYRDKQQLLDAVKESSLAPLSEKIDDILGTPMSPERRLRAYALHYLTYFHEQRDLFRILLYEREVTRVQGSRYQADRYKRLVDSVTRVIREGIADGSFRDVPAQHLAAMFVEAGIAIVNQRLLTEHPVAVEDDAALIADVFLRGIAIASIRSPE
jgi:AcrR family transcriptional regulator